MAKKLKLKLPKRIGGVKIPKKVRKGPIADFISSPVGQLLIAESLLVIAGAFAAKRTDPDSPAGDLIRHPIENLKAAGRSAAAAGAQTRGNMARSSARLSAAFSEAARAFRNALDEDRIDVPEAVISRTADQQTPGEPARSEPAKKKSSVSMSDPTSTPH